ncbi:ABC transporter substrate-binding protein [Williamsia sp. CHRR-6]|nr:ABC transporter substrate-binding protein [Williamsia sp. CHRR-6]
MLPPRSGLSPFSDDAFKLSRWSTGETLVVLDAAGDAKPALSTAWRRVDPTTWRFELRSGVRFHDDTPLTAQTVVGALTAATRAKPVPRVLDGVEVTARADGNAVLVATKDPDPLLPQRLSSPQLTILAPAAYRDPARVDPIRHGTGAFVLTSVNGRASAKLDRFDRYWGGKAKLAGIDVDFVPEGQTRAAALRNGSADVVEAVPVSQASLVDGALLHPVQMPRTNTLYLNTRRGPFAQAGLRAAARSAVDRQRLVDQVYEGRADTAQGLLGPAIPWSKDRPARTEAPAGNPAGATITLATFTDRPELPEVATVLAEELTARGFTVKQVVREYQFIENDMLAGVFDAFILSRATVLDTGDPLAYLRSDFSCAGSFNISQFCDPAVDAAMNAAGVLEAGLARQTATLDVEKQILERDVAVPLLHERVLQGESRRVANVARDPRERELITNATTID